MGLCIECNRNKTLCKNLCRSCYNTFLIKTKQKGSEYIYCECGCGSLLSSINMHYKLGKFIKGHNLRKKGNNYYPWKGRLMHSRGYRMLYFPEHPSSQKSGYVFEHVYVMTYHIDRTLNSDEVIHHKNKNKLDNRIENLQLVTRSTHPSEHKKDMSDRECAICDTKTTYVDKKRGYQVWHHYGDDAWLCHWCHVLYWDYTCFGDKDISEFDSRPRLDMSSRRCLNPNCKNPTKSRIDSRGYEYWHKYNDGFICVRCYKRLYRGTLVL